jgi:hypothetical protein
MGAKFQIHPLTALSSGETTPGTKYMVDRISFGFDPKVTGNIFAPAGDLTACAKNKF